MTNCSRVQRKMMQLKPGIGGLAGLQPLQPACPLLARRMDLMRNPNNLSLKRKICCIFYKIPNSQWIASEWIGFESFRIPEAKLYLQNTKFTVFATINVIPTSFIFQFHFCFRKCHYHYNLGKYNI